MVKKAKATKSKAKKAGKRGRPRKQAEPITGGQEVQSTVNEGQ